MKGFLAGRAEAVPRPFVARVPSCKFQDARRTPWRLTAKFAHAVGPVYPISSCTPPLLPAPGAASFSTTTGADLGHLRHLATRLVQLSASKAGLSGAALVDALAGYKDQLDTLVSHRENLRDRECLMNMSTLVHKTSRLLGQAFLSAKYLGSIVTSWIGRMEAQCCPTTP